jgi:hypothetical protein
MHPSNEQDKVTLRDGPRLGDLSSYLWQYTTSVGLAWKHTQFLVSFVFLHCI